MRLSMTMGALLAGSLALPPAAMAQPMAAQQYITVRSEPIGASTKLGGTVEPLKEVSFAAQAPGRISFIAGVEGDYHPKDTVLVSLNDDSLKAKWRAAYAEFVNAEAGVGDAKVQYTREIYSGSAMESENTGMAIPKMFDRYMTRPFSDMIGADNPKVARWANVRSQGARIQQAQARLEQARAALQELRASLRDTKSIAPFDGVIVRKHIEVGDTVQPGMPLLEFADTRNLQIKVDVPARLMPGVKQGMSIPAKLDVGDAQIETRVAQIFPMADPQRHTVTVKLAVPPNVPGGPGMYAEVSIPDVTSPVEQLPVIPKTAVLWRGSLPAVTVLGSSGQPELRMIRLGGFVNNNAVSVLSGLSPGDRILANAVAAPTGVWNPAAQAAQ
ncbi:putative RND family efflux transporter MFP subunit [Magnetofaba australis IT-1]|uniref:Putative RND family efflux transporter MFP subunit n=2 Tax=Magnetofaba TaxID=1472292 RepID=A0A1Y2KAS9_9PROT|nr:putative RND family efflux transporter MFP subunit [Magnetofaba australis IT-1]